jgi:proteic killer suppression protein
MKFRTTRHKGLKSLIENDDPKGIRADQIKRVRNIQAALIYAADVDELDGPPGWRIHQLVGDRVGTWSISASGNWRITSDAEDREILNLDLEDYY